MELELKLGIGILWKIALSPSGSGIRFSRKPGVVGGAYAKEKQSRIYRMGSVYGICSVPDPAQSISGV